MCGTFVRMHSSMPIAPRSVRVDAGRLEAEALDVRREAHGHEHLVGLERARLAVGAPYETVTDDPSSVTVCTFVDVRIGTPSLRYWRVISFETSTSSFGSARSRNSMTVTSTP